MKTLDEYEKRIIEWAKEETRRDLKLIQMFEDYCRESTKCGNVLTWQFLYNRFDKYLERGPGFYMTLFKYFNLKTEAVEQMVRDCIQTKRSRGNKKTGLTMRKLFLIANKVHDSVQFEEYITRVHNEKWTSKQCMALFINEKGEKTIPTTLFYSRLDRVNVFYENMKPEDFKLQARANIIEHLYNHLKKTLGKFNEFRKYNGVYGVKLKQLSAFYPEEFRENKE